MQKVAFARIIALATLLIVMVSTPPVSIAQDATLEEVGIDLSSPAFLETVRKKYVNDTSMPDHIAFPILISTIEDLYRQDPTNASNVVRSQLRLSESDAVALVDKILQESTGSKEEQIAKSKELFCDSGMPRVAGKEVFRTMDTYDDELEQINERRFLAFKSGLSEAEKSRLTSWLSSIKESTVHIVYDHEKHYARIGADPDVVMSYTCGT